MVRKGDEYERQCAKHAHRQSPVVPDIPHRCLIFRPALVTHRTTEIHAAKRIETEHTKTSRDGRNYGVKIPGFRLKPDDFRFKLFLLHVNQRRQRPNPCRNSILRRLATRNITLRTEMSDEPVCFTRVKHAHSGDRSFASPRRSLDLQTGRALLHAEMIRQ